MRLDPALAAQRRAVRDALADVVPGAVVLVGCSGGQDSLALAAATVAVAPHLGVRAGAVVVDHGLQPDSDVVAARAADQCRELGLEPVEVVVVDATGSGGPEAAARDARHAALFAAEGRHGAVAILLGHTLDDQAESVLLGLARGSGARSLAGMAPRRDPIRRPFLGIRRSQTLRACELLGLEPWHDPSNGPGAASPLRSQVRHVVMPVLDDVLGPGVPEALARTAGLLREDADLLEEQAATLLATARTPDGDLEVAALEGTATGLRWRALRLAMIEAGVPAGALTMGHVATADALVVDWRGQAGVSLPGGSQIVRRYGRLTVVAGTTRGAASGGSIGPG